MSSIRESASTTLKFGSSIALFVLLYACGSSSAVRRVGSGERVEASRLEQLVDSVRPEAGFSLEQQSASLLAAARDQQMSIRRCMQDAGLKYDVSVAAASVRSPLGHVTASPDRWWIAPADDAVIAAEGIGYLNAPYAVEPPLSNDYYSALDDDDARQRYDSQLATCGDLVGSKASERNEAALSRLYSLEASLAGAAASDEFADIQESYRHCMEVGGFEVGSPSELFDAVEAFAAEYVGEKSIDSARLKDPASQEWNDILAFESKIARADKSCREPLLDKINDVLLPVARHWFVDNP